ADGIKKSISSPGPGNYITVAKAAGLVRSVLGGEAIRRRSMMFAHGSSTPQNRVTESRIFDRVAAAFGIDNWPVCAVKAYVGHSIATASGDQIVAAIGAMRHGIVPGIKTGAAIADDVHRQHLNIPLGDLEVGAGGLDAALINAKGFGGNNATGVVLSPARAEAMVAKRHGQRWAAYQQQREATRERAADYASAALRGEQRIIYRFGDGMIEDDTLEITASCLRVPGFGKPIPLDEPNPYGDMGGGGRARQFPGQKIARELSQNLPSHPVNSHNSAPFAGRALPCPARCHSTPRLEDSTVDSRRTPLDTGRRRRTLRNPRMGIGVV